MPTASLDKQELTKKRVRFLVHTGLMGDDAQLAREAKALRLRKNKLSEACVEYRNSLLTTLNNDELHVLFRANIQKLVELLHEPSNRFLPAEVARLTTTLNDTIKTYREALVVDDSATQSNDRLLLDGLLQQLYATPEGIKLIEQVEKLININ